MQSTVTLSVVHGSGKNKILRYNCGNTAAAVATTDFCPVAMLAA